MTINILAFGIVKEIVSSSRKALELGDSTTVARLKNMLETAYPEMKQLKSYMVAGNDDYAEDDLILSANDEVAIIPPVSGG